MQDIVQNPHFWSALAIASILLFAFTSDKAAADLGFTVTDTTQAPVKSRSSLVVPFKFALVLSTSLALVYLLKSVHFYFTLAVLIGFFAYFWALTYKRRIRRLKDAGLPTDQVILLCSLVTLFCAFAVVAIALFAWANRVAP